MSYCLNPACQKPQNPGGHKFCQSCGTKLLLRARYRAIKPIGQGGMGRTFLAQDVDRLDAHCVIKQFLPLPNIQGNSEAMAKATELFKQEAHQLLQLGEHPQIPSLYAYFEEDKRLYLVQQYIEGWDLGKELETQGAFDEEQIWQLLTDLLPVLQFIHDRGVIHRDIKPHNIIRRQSDGQMVLIDFGVSKQLSGTRLAITGTQIGTQGYAPLEQLRFGKAYPASDLYSLGVTCIQLLTRSPLDELFDILDFRWVWKELLSQRGIISSDRLACILDKMLAESVKNRFPSASEVLQASGIASFPLTHRKKVSSKILFPPPPKWQCVRTLTGHSGPVWSVSISPNGEILASGSDDKTIKLWQLKDGKLLHTLTDHSNPIYSVTIGPDGRTLISGSIDKTIKLWQLSTGKLVHTLLDYSNSVYCVAIAPNGKFLVNGSKDQTIKIWHINGKLIRTLAGHSDAVYSVAISPDGQILASASADRTTKLWQMREGIEIGTLAGHSDAVYSVAISQDGQLLASASADRTIKLWQIKDSQLLDTLTGHLNTVYAVAISPDGQTLISGSEDKTIKLWRMSDRQLMDSLTGHSDWVWCVAIARDGQTLITGSTDDTIKIWRCQ